MKRVTRLFLSLIGLLLAGGLLLALGAYTRAGGAGTELALSHVSATVAGDLDQVRTTGFGSQVTIGSASGMTRTLAVGDLDSDGDLDLVSTGLYAWENPGTGALSSTWVSGTLAAGVNAWDVALGDLDQDGDLDAVATGHFGVVLWQNPWDGGSGSPFASWTVSHVLTTTTSGLVDEVVLADLDHDGQQDVIAARGYDTSTGWLCAWQNPGSFAGMWAQHVISHAAGFQALAAADLDRDGWIDLVSGSGDYAPATEVRAWRNDGTPFAGAWAGNRVVELWVDLGGDDANGLALADLDGDGWTDIALGFEHLTNGRLGVWRNPGALSGAPFAGTWSVSQTMTTGDRVGNVAAADWDGDGDVDVVSVPETGGNEVLWWRNDGRPFDGEWTWNRDWGASTMAHDVLLADLDRDGDLDTAVVGGGAIAAWPNELAPNTWPPASAEVGIGDPDDRVSAVAAGDLDRDGDVDMVSSGLYAWENPYPNTSAAPWFSGTLEVGVDARDIALADLDHDGDLDAVGVGGFGVAIWQNPWEGGASTPFGSWPVSYVLTTSQSLVNKVVVADLDRDGWTDVAAASGQVGFGGWLCVWRNPHTLGGAWAANTITDTVPLVSIAAADLNRDGWVDLATGSAYASSIEIRAWDNDGTPFAGPWSSSQVVDLKAQDPGAQSANSLSVADLDGDGWQDIAAGLSWSSGGRIGVWRNPGTPFATRWPLSVTMGANDFVLAVATGDLDHDGDVDVASATYPDEKVVAWWENDGSPFDAPWSVVRAWPTGVGAHDLLLADVNKNADLDTVVSGEGTSKVLALLAQWQRIYLPAAANKHVRYFAGPWESEPNDSIAQANGALVSGQDYFGYPNDADDYYSVYLQSAGHLDVALTSTITVGLELSLWYGSPASQVGWDSSAPYGIGYDGPAGGYYVRVYHANPVTTTVPYTLRVTYP